MIRTLLLAALVPAFAQDREALEAPLRELQAGIAGAPAAVRADVEVFAKGAAWALRHEATLAGADLALVRKALDRGRQRLRTAADPPWTRKKGKLVRGFVSAVDGSVQPFGLVIPAGYDPARPIRLDVVLHGSTRPAGLSELRFMSRFDDGDEGGAAPPEADFIELHPLGRVENGYRWAGETDVHEAIEAACRLYPVDRSRIVLRGMSMGASGTWHLGLKRPDRFAALGPWCGYVDTHRFSETPGMNFVPVGPLPPDQERMLHLLDSVDYAANAGAVPVVAAMGDQDPFFQAHVIMGEAMKREGLELVNLIAPGTGHAFEPATRREQMRRLGEIAAKGLDPMPRRVRFVTWTLKYPRCFWVELLGLGEHYARAEVDAALDGGGGVEVSAAKNVTRLAIHAPARRIRIEGAEVRATRSPAVLVRKGGAWEEAPAGPLEGKRPGLQGPIDDAFTSRFLCVRGTGAAWNPAVGAWAEASLARFSREWHRYFRGELPVKDDTAVSDEDLRTSNLVLFGDPGSNRWTAKVLPSLPIRWTREELKVGAASHPAAGHAPALVFPSPLAEGRYVVLNSGHSFHEKELSTLNYLLFPRLADWAVFATGSGEPVAGGFFDEAWKLPR
jgi:hypothetical protein